MINEAALKYNLYSVFQFIRWQNGKDKLVKQHTLPQGNLKSFDYSFPNSWFATSVDHFYSLSRFKLHACVLLNLSRVSLRLHNVGTFLISFCVIMQPIMWLFCALSEKDLAHIANF